MSELIERIDCRMALEDTNPTTEPPPIHHHSHSDEGDNYHEQTDTLKQPNKPPSLLSKLFSNKAKAHATSRSTSTETVRDHESETISALNDQVNPLQPAEIIKRLKREQEKEQKKKRKEDKKTREADEKFRKQITGGAAWGFDPAAGKQASDDAKTSGCSPTAENDNSPLGLRKRSQGTWGAEHGGPTKVIHRDNILFRRTG